MNRRELAVVIKYAQQVWPRTFTVPGDDADTFATVWLDLLGEFDGEAVLAALRAESAGDFPPSPGRLRQTLLRASGAVAGWDLFARWVRSEAARASLYCYDDHPPLVCPWPELEGVVTVEDVQGWARQGLKESDLETVVIAHVRHRYTAAAARAETAAMVGARPMLARGGEPQQIGGTDE